VMIVGLLGFIGSGKGSAIKTITEFLQPKY
jgi:dephospho-CoA kinase